MNRDHEIAQGYGAWVAGGNMDLTQTPYWIEGWNIGEDGAYWKRFASLIDATLTGYSGRNSASVVFYSGGVSQQITGSLADALFSKLEHACEPIRFGPDEPESIPEWQRGFTAALEFVRERLEI